MESTNSRYSEFRFYVSARGVGLGLWGLGFTISGFRVQGLGVEGFRVQGI